MSFILRPVLNGKIGCFSFLTILAACIGSMVVKPAFAQEDPAALAQELSNPIASLISVPFQWNYNDKIGPVKDGQQYYLNLQPVIPVPLTEEWTMISRTILPIISQHDIFPGANSQFGFGDITQSLFFSPKPGALIWGVGPAFNIPTATDDLLGSSRFGVGPTGVALWQGSGWTIGILANQIWSVGDAPADEKIDQAFLQPFISYTTPSAWTFTLNTESTYNWLSNEWSVPINGMISKLVTIDKQPVSLGAGIRYWADSPEGVGPEGWGARAVVTFLFPARH